jgi:hypothetical protein
LIRGYDPHWIPGLLQTPEYARASVQTGFPDAAGEEVDRRVELRLACQHVLARPDVADAENADVGGVHDADGKPGNSGGVVGQVPGYIGTVPD